MSEAQPIWTDPRTWRFRDKVTASSLNVDVRDNLLWLKRYLSREADITVTVGTDSSTDDYPSISAALQDLSRMRPIFMEGGPVTAEVKLRSGFTVAEQVVVRAVDLSWVTLTSEDAEVTVSRSAISDDDPVYATQSAFVGHDCATLPVIGTTFTMDTSDTIRSTRLFAVRHGSTLIFEPSAGGAKGGADRLVEISHGSVGVLRLGTVADGAGIGVRVSNGSILHAGNATITSNETANVAAAGGSIAVCSAADLSGGVTDGVRSFHAHVEVNGANMSGCGRHALWVTTAGNAQANGADTDLSNAGDTALKIEEGYVYAPSATITGAGSNAVEMTGGRAQLEGADLSNATAAALDARDGAVVTGRDLVAPDAGTFGARIRGSWASLQNADLSGAGDPSDTAHKGLLAAFGSNVNAQGANTRKDTTTPADNPEDTEVQTGSTINAGGVTGGLSQTANSVTADGIIFQ